jgi:hypothetical protein
MMVLGVGGGGVLVGGSGDEIIADCYGWVFIFHQE